MIRIIFFVTAIFLFFDATSQLTDSFDDGDFLSDPGWSGQNSFEPPILNAFEIAEIDHQLKSQSLSGSSGTRISYLSTAIAPINLVTADLQWTFRLKNDFTFSNASSSGNNNHSRVYLVSDVADLSGDVDGYYLRLKDIANGDEEVRLFRQSGGTSAEITLNGNLQPITSQAFVDVQVTRTNVGTWQVFVDGESQGTGSDNIHTNSNFFGVQVRYSANSRSGLFYFDDFSMVSTPVADNILPSIDTVIVNSVTEITINFSEPVDLNTSQSTENYSVNNGILVTNAVRNNMDQSEVILTTSELSNGESYILTINGVEDQNANTIAENAMENFEYVVYSIPTFRDVVINEFIVDPNSSTSIPNAEFVELYNSTDNFFNLNGLVIRELSAAGSIETSDPMANYTLRPGSYVIITDNSHVSSFEGSGEVLGVSGFPGFNLTNSSVILLDENDAILDHLIYASEPPRDGVSYEQINPYLPCGGPFNFLASSSATGGTPGTINSVFNDAEDVTGPFAVTVSVITSDSLHINFSEPVQNVNHNTVAIQGFSITAIGLINDQTVVLRLDTELISESAYTMDFLEITDCSSNLVAPGTFSFYYDVTPPLLQKIIVNSYRSIFAVFNEVLSEPIAESEENYSLNQGFGVPVKATLQDSAKNRVLLEFESSFTIENPYQLAATNITDTSTNVAGILIENFIFQDQIGTIKVIASNILEINLTETPTLQSAIDAQSYLTSEGDRPQVVLADEVNATIFRLVFGNSFDDNKEHQLFVEGLISAAGNEMITPAETFVYDTKSPSIEDVLTVSPNEIALVFDELLDENSATNLSFYQLEDEAFPSSATLTNNLVNLIFDNPFEIEQEKTLTYTRVADLENNFSTSKRTKKFTYDPVAPSIDSLFQFDERTIRVYASEQLQDTSLSTTNFLLVDGQMPLAIKIYGPDSASLDLSFENSLPVTASLPLTVNDWQDLKGNRLSSSITSSLDAENPRLAQVTPLSDSTLELVFSMEMAEEAFLSENYGVVGLEIERVVQQNLRTVLLEVNEEFLSGGVYQIEMNGLRSKSGKTLQFNTSNFTYDTYLLKTAFLDAQTLELDFSTEYSEIASNSVLIDGNYPALISVDPLRRSIIRVLLKEDIVENESIFIQFSNLRDRFGRVIPNHQYLFTYDTEAPLISHVASDFNSAINITFNESIDQNTLQSSNQILISDQAAPTHFAFEDGQSIQATFNSLESGVSYDLVVDNFSDLQGNYQQADTFSFTYSPPLIVPPGAVLISEIMADPTPSKGLPEHEYLELLNVSDQTYNLRSLYLTKANSEVRLKDFVMEPGQYLTIIDQKDSANFEAIPLMTVPSLFSFSNNGDSIVIINIDGALVNKVEYSVDWYRDSEKDDGGYSLELIDPLSDCGGAANWSASIDSLGGTPGLQNSVYSLAPDSLAPNVLFSEILSDTVLLVVFNEEMDPGSFDGMLIESGVLTIQNVSFLEDLDKIQIEFIQTIPQGEVQHLVLTNVRDCSGNTMEAISIQFGFGDRPGFNDLILTEIMADPDPSVGLPNTEYLEVYNASTQIIDLSEVYIEDASGKSGFMGGILSPGEFRTMVPSSSVSSFQPVTVVALSNWVSLSNGGEWIGIGTGDETIFQVEYTSDWHDLEKKSGGFSLEMRDLNNPCGQKENWGSSMAMEGGTPGEQNSISESVPDNFGPNLVAAFAISSDTVRFDFDEYLSPESIPSIIISPSVKLTIDSSRLYAQSIFGFLKKNLEQGIEYEVSASEIMDCNGNQIQGSSTTLVLPFEALQNEVLISEILFNPRTSGADFVEVHNTSDKPITMKNWHFANEIDLKKIFDDELIIGAGSYLAFTEDANQLVLDYPKATVGNIIQIESLPSFSDDEGMVKLLNDLSLLQDSLSYFDDFHSPLLSDDEGISLERISFSQPNRRENWRSAASTVGFATPGYANSQNLDIAMFNDPIEIEPKVFVPGVGVRSFTTINYQFDAPGNFANIRLYDQNGRKVKTLASGASLNTTGFITWDGTNDSGAGVRMGYYLVVFEVFSGSGFSETYKETVVVGADF